MIILLFIKNTFLGKDINVRTLSHSNIFKLFFSFILMEKEAKKKAAIELSFTFIFALLLIAVFIVVAVTAIKSFLCTADAAKAGMFYSSLSKKINEAWWKSSYEESSSFYVPSSVEKVCFANLSKWPSGVSDKEKAILGNLTKYHGNAKANVFFWPIPEKCFENLAYYKIKCEESECIALSEMSNPYCINATKGKVSIKIIKEFGKANVNITR